MILVEYILLSYISMIFSRIQPIWLQFKDFGRVHPTRLHINDFGQIQPIQLQFNDFVQVRPTRLHINDFSRIPHIWLQFNDSS